jgi:hypothetical protein
MPHSTSWSVEVDQNVMTNRAIMAVDGTDTEDVLIDDTTNPSSNIPSMTVHHAILSWEPASQQLQQLWIQARWPGNSLSTLLLRQSFMNH